MRALRRIATPTGLGIALVGCSLPVDEFQPPSNTGSLVGNTDGGTTDDAANDAGDAATDAHPLSADAGCTCVKTNGGGKCREWSPPGCGG